jgi:NCS1 family nucleobase:cation symporter-1
LLRGGVAIVWFGIQTYLASMVLEVVLITVWPSLTRFSEYIVLGLSELGWSSFLILWGIQIIIGRYGMESIRRYETFAGPIILANFVFLAGWVAYSAGGRFTWPSPSTSLIGGDWLHIAGAASLWVSVYGTFVLSFCDFTRNATSFGAVIRGNFWGLPINVMLFAAITLILTGGQLEINGILIQSPTDVVNGIPSTALLIAASIALIVLTIAVNLMANFVSASYALMNFFPQQLNFRTASVICAIGGLVILPWNLYNSPRIILVLLMGLGVVLGPLFGIIIADYWILRGRNVDVTALYSSSSTADFFYRKGYNPRAFGVAFIAMIVCTIIQVWPLFETWREFSWVIGAVMSAFLYVLVSPRMKGCLNRDGEAIAVAGDH